MIILVSYTIPISFTNVNVFKLLFLWSEEPVPKAWFLLLHINIKKQLYFLYIVFVYVLSNHNME